jgi:lipopolysaccharide export system protein LptA
VCWRIETRAALAARRGARPALTAALLGAAVLAAVPAPARAAGTGPAPSPAAVVAPAVDPATGPTPLLARKPIPATLAACEDPVCYTASGLGIDAQRNHMELFNFEAVDTTRGLTYLSTDRLDATGAGKRLDFGNSDWLLTGHVHVDTSDGQLESSTATVKFADKRIVAITANGTPALFQHVAGSGSSPRAGAQRAGGAQGAGANLTVHGHADTITYDLTKDEVHLNGDSWFTDGCNDITSQRITYNVTTQSVLANSAPGSKARVHGTIRNTRPGTPCTSGSRAAGAAGAAGAAAGPVRP